MLGFGLIKGLFVTLRNLFGPIFTIQYPDKRAGIFELSLIHISEPTRPERIGYGVVGV